MEKIENYLKKDRSQGTGGVPKRLLFLLLLLVTQLFACGQVVGWPDSDSTTPTVKFVTPADNSTDVAINASISATFSEAINPETITISTFTLFKGSIQVTGTVVYSGVTAIFTPATILDPETEYVATVTSKVKDLAGNLMTKDFEWNFTTGKTFETVPPQVIATIPLKDAVDVVFTAEIIAVFSEAMNPLTITAANFTLLDGTTPVDGTVSYVGVTATFTPIDILDQNTLYTAVITAEVSDLAGNKMAEEYVWNFTTGSVILDTISPTVISTIPDDGDIDVEIDTNVSAVFSEAINPLTINDETFTLQNGIVMIDGEITKSGNTVTFNSTNDLEPGTEYTATITNNVTDLAGNAMKENYVWKFTTASEAVLPTIISSIPLDKAENVVLDIDISAEFSKEMNDLTITDLTFLVTDDLLAPVDGAVAYDALTKTATFNPDSDLETDTEYTVTITTGVEDTTGLTIEMDYVWTFTTEAAPTVVSTIPLDMAEDVTSDTDITAVFSKEMNDLTITDLTFLVTDDLLAPVDGAVAYDALTKTATFNPDSDLNSDTEYTVTITIGVESTTGIAMDLDYIWTFTTDAAPTVISTIPLDMAEDVALDTEITAVFSEEMNGLTITDLIDVTFTVTESGITPVDGVVSYDALTKTASFTPDSDLLFDTEYTATITTGVENLTGTAMEEDFIWTFSTGVGTVDLKLISPFAIASAAGIDNTGATHINGDVVLDPNFTCNDVPGVHDGTFGLCDGKAPTISGTVITNQYPDTVTSAAIMADLLAAYLSIMKANLPDAIVLGCGTIGSNGGAGALIGCAGNSTLAPGVYIVYPEKRHN